MNGLAQLILFKLDSLALALPLQKVERVVRSVEITPLPKAPAIIIGVVNVRGEVIPMADIRSRFNLPAKKLLLTDNFIIAKTAKRKIGIITDSVEGVIERPEEAVIAPENILEGVGHIKGVLKLGGGIVLIHDIDSFLSIEEEKALDAAVEASERDRGESA